MVSHQIEEFWKETAENLRLKEYLAVGKCQKEDKTVKSDARKEKWRCAERLVTEPAAMVGNNLQSK